MNRIMVGRIGNIIRNDRKGRKDCKKGLGKVEND